MEYDHTYKTFNFTVFTVEDENTSTILGLVFSESFNDDNIDYVLMDDENPIPFDMHKTNKESHQDLL